MDEEMSFVLVKADVIVPDFETWIMTNHGQNWKICVVCKRLIVIKIDIFVLYWLGVKGRILAITW